MSGSKLVTANRRRSVALVALTVVNAAAPLIADSAQAELRVSVTVARSCVVDVQPVVGGAPRLLLECATGAGRDVQVSESTRTATAVESGTPHRDLPVVVVNF